MEWFIRFNSTSENVFRDIVKMKQSFDNLTDIVEAWNQLKELRIYIVRNLSSFRFFTKNRFTKTLLRAQH